MSVCMATVGFFEVVLLYSLICEIIKVVNILPTTTTYFIFLIDLFTLFILGCVGSSLLSAGFL